MTVNKDAIYRAKKDKQKGWPPCTRCDQWMPISCECRAINAEGLAPCKVMSRKLFNYLLLDAERKEK